MQKNRGMFLEKIINNTISFYEKNNLAIFHKKELTIIFSKIIKSKNKPIIKNGWIKNKSTIDYYGLYQGKFIAFEAKSTKQNSLPLSNIKKHQLDYLKNIEKHGGVSFLFIYFTKYEKAFIIFFNSLKKLKQKSISYEFASLNGKKMEITYPGIIDFLNYL